MLFQKADSVMSDRPDAIQENDQKILVFYPADEKVGSSVIKQIATKMCELNVLSSILVLKGTTSIARRELE